MAAKTPKDTLSPEETTSAGVVSAMGNSFDLPR